MIKINRKTMKTFVFSLGLAAMTLTANHLNAQNRGLFGLGGSSADYEYSSRGLTDVYINSDTGTGIQNDSFGAPLGSGLMILLGAGLGYVALKKKEDQQ
jgi:hypothetical protein